MKKNLMTRVSALLLTVIMLIAVGVACAEQTPSGSDETTVGGSETQTPSADELSNLPLKNFNGLTVTVMTRRHDSVPQFDSYEVATESDTNALDDAINRRNDYVEETYGITLNEIKEANPGQKTSIMALSNDDTVDYVVSQMTDLRAFVSSGALYDLNNSTYFEYDKPWWHEEINETYSIANKLFMTMNDYLLMYKQQSYCIFFNKTMADNLQLDNLYDTVDAGDWTWDLMYQYMQLASDDLDGDTQMTPDDQYGYVTQYGGLLASVVCSDVHFSYKDENDLPVIDGNNMKHSNVLGKLYDIYVDKENTILANDYTDASGNVDWGLPETIFNAERALFMNSVVRISKEIVSVSEVDYGIIPLPKISDEQDEYATFSELYNSTVFAIPVTADFDTISYLLEAFSVASYDIVVPAYYEVTLKSRYAPDDRAKIMLDIIFSNYRIDTLLSYNWMDIYGFYDLILINKTNTYESYYAGALDAAHATVNKLLEEVGKLE